jgi:hypothetical protein
MIKNFDEMGKENPIKKSSFKKFSDLKSTGIKSPKDTKEDPSSEILPLTDDKLPGNPNLPNKNSKFIKDLDTSYLQPVPEQDQDETEGEDRFGNVESTDEKVKFYGKIAKFPKKTKASKAFNFLENVKISKNSIWYIMVEKQDSELQMVKYNYKKGVDLAKFISELKTYYAQKYSSNKKLVELVEKIEIDGNDKYSWVKNIPPVEIDGRKMISKITEDLIKLLSK